MWPSSRTKALRYSRGMEHAVSLDDARLVKALRARDDRVFEELMRMSNASLLRVAQIYVASRAVAEEVVQDTWIGVLNGIDRFEGRSTLKTWIFRILTNIAKTRGQREGRTIPFSAVASDNGPAVDPERFRADGHWASPPASWGPEERLLGGETREVIDAAIAELPP